MGASESRSSGLVSEEETGMKRSEPYQAFDPQHLG